MSGLCGGFASLEQPQHYTSGTLYQVMELAQEHHRLYEAEALLVYCKRDSFPLDTYKVALDGVRLTSLILFLKETVIFWIM